MLRARPELQVSGEASDGLEAIQKAQELQPDLILLDLGLPKLNGIEVARQIRGCSPKSKVLFLSENRSWNVAEEAFRTGAGGYVVKSSAATELLPAVKAVLHGKRFVSASLMGHDLADSVGKHTLDEGQCKEVVGSPLPRNVEIKGQHEVEFYRDDTGLVSGFACSIEAALKIGNAAAVIATDSHRASLFHKLRADGVDVDAAIEQGSYIPLDTTDTLSMFMVNDLPEPVVCSRVVSDLIVGAARGAKGEHPRVTICGECAPTLIAEGNAEAAVRLERLWDEITRSYAADTLCGYLWSAFQHKESGAIFTRICAEHSSVQGYWVVSSKAASFPRVRDPVSARENPQNFVLEHHIVFRPDLCC
jgi:CheY-like chemotaxis protein